MNHQKNDIPTYTLSTGKKMPMLGYGTWGLDDAEENTAYALEVGYRHIDTAKIYGTEEAVGKAVQKSNIEREKMFITTKLWNTDQGYEPALAAIDESLEKLSMEYVDLYLIHWPLTKEDEGENKREETWRAMEQICESGKARAIGVSNYKQEHIEEMEEYADIKPSVNQIERHPFYAQAQTTEYCHNQGIAVTNYSPLTRREKFDHPVLADMAGKYQKSIAQILLRWGIEHGDIVIPKSSNKVHIRENMDIFDFEIEESDLEKMDELDAGDPIVS